MSAAKRFNYILIDFFILLNSALNAAVKTDNCRREHRCPLIDVSTYIVMQSLFRAMTLIIFYDEYFKEYVSITSGGEGLDG